MPGYACNTAASAASTSSAFRSCPRCLSFLPSGSYACMKSASFLVNTKCGKACASISALVLANSAAEASLKAAISFAARPDCACTTTLSKVTLPSTSALFSSISFLFASSSAAMYAAGSAVTSDVLATPVACFTAGGALTSCAVFVGNPSQPKLALGLGSKDTF